MLNRFASEVSQYQNHGESKENAINLVSFLIAFSNVLLFKFHSNLYNFGPQYFQSYQLAEELARAFTERKILQIFMDTEMTLPAGPLKVNLRISLHFLIFVGVNF